ncbi:hypothetical protein HBI56_176160 [Parastagonospora nodorum]|nr:hypothetical protein HBH56_237300 [Parastagonospora nodorum]KAH3924206.1 hypothetical protein HBH54_197520 [Parastagonospora nodorum]KAH3968427.1 hypothetical protein HBH52_179960 [Parastagonospora nodorum]KAH3993353.1 hypothetical protein HBI10_203490 [Parastagonospora nodorum]KAH4082789.1 hypothetical protein HBH48_183210 [Parastagonospora nodorum]
MSGSTSGKAYLIHEALVALLWLCFDADKYVAYVLDYLSTDVLIEEGSGEDLEDESGTTVLVVQDLLQDLVVEEQGLENSVTSLRFIALVDDLENSQVSHLVGAEVNQVWNKARCQHCSSPGKGACVQEPGEEECSVGVCGKLDAVECNSSSNHALLIFGGEVALKTSTHGTSTKATLGEIPKAAEHDLEDELVVLLVLEAALHDVVSELVQEQSHCVWLKGFDDHLLHARGLGDINNLLSSPCAVLVHTNLSELGYNFAQHGFFGRLFAEFEKLLYNSVA